MSLRLVINAFLSTLFASVLIWFFSRSHSIELNLLNVWPCSVPATICYGLLNRKYPEDDNFSLIFRFYKNELIFGVPITIGAGMLSLLVDTSFSSFKGVIMVTLPSMVLLDILEMFYKEKINSSDDGNNKNS